MKSIASILSLVILVSLGSRAVAFQENFPDIPEDTWVEKSLQRFRDQGLYKEPIYLSGPGWTKTDYAQFLKASVNKLEALTVHAEKLTAGLEAQVETYRANFYRNMKALKMPRELAKVPQWDEDTPWMLWLTETLEPQLEEIGVNVPSMRRRLISIQRRLPPLHAKAVIAVATTTAVPEIPRHRFIDEVLKGFLLNGLTANLSSGHRPLSRIDACTMLISGSERLIEWSKRAETEIPRLKQQVETSLEAASIPATIEHLADLAGIVDLLEDHSRRLKETEKTIDFFEVELKAMGRNPQVLKRQLRRALDDRLK